MLIIDGHQDLAWNISSFGRDYTHSVKEIRNLEKNLNFSGKPEDTLLGWPDYIQGEVGMVFATLFAAPLRHRLNMWDKVVYSNQAEALKLYQQQLDIYYSLVDKHPEKFQLIQSRADLGSLFLNWPKDGTDEHAVGLVVLMEGAEAISSPDDLERWWQAGVRIIGPAWAGNRFCGGTGEPGPLTSDGYALLDGMAANGFVLDLSHMDEKAVLQALDFYPGAIIASHSNARSLLNKGKMFDKNPGHTNNRHLTDEMIDGIIHRQGVIGVVFYNDFLFPGWREAQEKQDVCLQHVFDQIDYICQIAGNSQHVAIGTDFDGGLGAQSTPVEIDTIADLQKLNPFLIEKGYQQADIEAIFSGNWLRVMRGSLPENT